MVSVTAFGGVVGEAIRGLLTPAAWLRLIPTGLAMGAVAVAAGVAGSVFAVLAGPFGAVVPLLLSLIAIAPIVGRYALTARSGSMDGGLLSPELPQGALWGFVARYTVLTLAWGLPVLGALLVLIGLTMPGASWGGLGGGPSGGTRTAGITALYSTFLLIVLTVAPSLTVLVSLASDTVVEVFAADRWLWLLRDRRRDLPAYFGGIIGGGVVLMALALPFVILALGAGFGIHPIVGGGFAMIGYLVLGAMGVALWGRLSGFFVAVDVFVEAPFDEVYAPPTTIATSLPEGASLPKAAPAAPAARPRAPGPTAPAPPPEQSSGAPVGAPAEASRPQAADPDEVLEALRSVRGRIAHDLPGAVAEVEELASAHPRSPLALSELARLYDASKRPNDALALASRAIEVALAEGAATLAVGTYKGFKAQRKDLRLDAQRFLELAAALLGAGEHADAVWAYRAAGALGTDDSTVLQGIIAVADTAAAGGDRAMAIGFYEHLIAAYPSSPEEATCRAKIGALAARRGGASETPGR